MINWQISIQSSPKFEIEWSKSYGGSDIDEGWFVLATEDGGCAALGNTDSFSNSSSNIWMIKVDESGNELWNKSYGGTGWKQGKAIIETNNNGYAIVGSTLSYSLDGSNSDVWFIRVDESGKELWNKSYGGNGWDEGKSIINTSENGFMIVGSTNSFGAKGSDKWLIRVDESGNELWNKSYGGNGWDEGRFIDKGNNGSYIISGTTESFGEGKNDIWLIKIDSFGNEIWNKTFGCLNNDLSNQVMRIKDGYVLVGHTELGSQNEWGGIVIKTDENGDKIWETTVSQNVSAGISSIETDENGYIAIGYRGQYGNEQDLFILKIDENGKILWKNSIGGDYCDAGVWIDKISENSYFITGYQDTLGKGVNDLWLLKVKIN